MLYRQEEIVLIRHGVVIIAQKELCESLNLPDQMLERKGMNDPKLREECILANYA